MTHDNTTTARQRRGSGTRRRAITVRLPEDLVAQLDLLQQDELGRVRYGARQRLIEALLREHLARQRENRKP